MNELITKALTTRNTSPLVEFPQILLSEWEQECITWVTDYEGKYGEPPTPERLVKGVPTFVPLTNPEPLDDIRDQTIERKRNTYALSLLEAQVTALKGGSTFDPNAHIAELDPLTMSSAVVHKYTEFDRTKYFRTGTPIMTGIGLIDRATKGIFPGEVMLVVGRLGTGKSTLLQFFSKHLFTSAGRRILFISKEMPAEDVFARIDATLGHFNPLDLRTEGMAQEMKGQLEAIKIFAKTTGSEIIMPKMAVWDVEQIGVMAKAFRVDAIVVDGVYHLTTANARRGAANWEVLTSVSRSLKAIALDLNVPMLETSQLKRGSGVAEKFSEEDIAYADALAQDADFAIAIRPLGIPGKARAELQMIKNRYGHPITSLVETHFPTMTLREISTEGEA